MSPEEIAALRLMATASGLVSITGKELSTLLLERDHHAAEAKALREIAVVLAASIESSPRLTCEQAWEDEHCDRHATRLVRISRRDTDRMFCEAHAAELRPAEPGDRSLVTDEELPHAAPLRALRALLGRTP